MNEHPTEEDMVDGYYTGFAPRLQSHLGSCESCAALYSKICETLETAADFQAPSRGPNYGSEVWARISHQLPAKRSNRYWQIPALAALLAIGVMTFRFLPIKPSATPPQAAAAKVQPSTFVHITTPVSSINRKPKPKVIRVVHVPSDRERDAKLLALNKQLESDPHVALPQVINLIQGHASDRTQEHALFVLAQSDSAEAHKALLDMAHQSANPILQQKAVRMMTVMDGTTENLALTGLYRTSSNPALKQDIINGLLLSGSKNNLRVVATTEPDPNLRNAAIANLSLTAGSNLESPQSQKFDRFNQKEQILASVFTAANSHTLLDELKKQPNPAIRIATIRSLAIMGEQSNVLVDVYRADRDEGVRRAILDALVVQQNSLALADLARNETDEGIKADILNHLATLRTHQTIR